MSPIKARLSLKYSCFHLSPGRTWPSPFREARKEKWCTTVGFNALLSVIMRKWMSFGKIGTRLFLLEVSASPWRMHVNESTSFSFMLSANSRSLGFVLCCFQKNPMRETREWSTHELVVTKSKAWSKTTRTFGRKGTKFSPTASAMSPKRMKMENLISVERAGFSTRFSK